MRIRFYGFKLVILVLFCISSSFAMDHSKNKIPDTGQSNCYNNTGIIICPKKGMSFFGQDAQYIINPPAFRDNNDGTITDLNTGLMWTKEVNTKKLTYDQAIKSTNNIKAGGYTDWRIPTIKELYSIIDYNGYGGTPSHNDNNAILHRPNNVYPPRGDRKRFLEPHQRGELFNSRRGDSTNNFNGNMNGHRDMYDIPSNAIPFINTRYFDFEYGNKADGDRYMDAQWVSSTKYVNTTMNGNQTFFGVNFADGRIKGYPYHTNLLKGEKKYYVRYVRGPKSYGANKFVDNNDGTITDNSTGLMWSKKDSDKGMNWQDALLYCQNLSTAKYNDWRLPNAKELQYIVDYSRSPDTTNSPAIDPIFMTTQIANEGGQKDYPYFWTSTTHLDGIDPGSNAIYVSFGRALGKMHGKIMDVHGAGSVRSDPKVKTSKIWHGPQGDAIRSLNYVRCVRGGDVSLRSS
ncbi:DUF1566 domain-containing protein [Francisella sp. LA112445]|uniref:Lcl C-terminal domain-containing protein n=1 Tax=Francisella sp. LA112445 TaxID=1395624 RepID=UPI001788A2EF|nr:DUF1566 domain-containing protein [Francisella sp. LA112445]QIW09327.1 DUF1566 domain-containing protein [Francisella sp. LA112445]